MEVRKVSTNPNVAENEGKVALEYGPLVYAFEEIDQKSDMNELSIRLSDVFTPETENDLLDGVVTLNSDTLKAVPYYSWSNRGIGKMKVWVPVNKGEE